MNEILKRGEVLRRLTGSILGSSLSDDQIISLAHVLADDKEFSSDLSRSLLASIMSLSSRSFSTELVEPKGARDLADTMSVDHIVKWIVQHNIPKKQLIAKLLSRKIVQASPATLQSQSIREIVTRVFTSSSPSSITKLLDILGMDIEPDAYLEGIEGRRIR